MVLRCLAVLLVFASVCKVHGEGLGEYQFFAAASGSWVGEGELVDWEGKVIPIHEEWEGSADGSGSFAIKGERRFGDDLQDFRWEFSYNVATELIECEYWHTGMNEPSKFEVLISDESIELKTAFGEPGGELTVSNEISGTEMTGKVEAVNGNGEEILGGVVKHVKQG